MRLSFYTAGHALYWVNKKVENNCITFTCINWKNLRAYSIGSRQECQSRVFKLDHLHRFVGIGCTHTHTLKRTVTQAPSSLALTHPQVTHVDTCRAYFAGTNLFVEVDIVLPPTMELRESHDIGEDLQIKLESLPDVERAFVHVDYDIFHKPEASIYTYKVCV